MTLNTEAVVVQQAKVVLGAGVSLFGQALPDLMGRPVITAIEGVVTFVGLAPARCRRGQKQDEDERDSQGSHQKPRSKTGCGVMGLHHRKVPSCRLTVLISDRAADEIAF